MRYYRLFSKKFLTRLRLCCSFVWSSSENTNDNNAYNVNMNSGDWNNNNKNNRNNRVRLCWSRTNNSEVVYSFKNTISRVRNLRVGVNSILFFLRDL